MKIRVEKVWQRFGKDLNYHPKLAINDGELVVVVHKTPGVNGTNHQRVSAVMRQTEDSDELGAAWLAMIQALVQWLPDQVRDEVEKYLERPVERPPDPPRLWRPGDPR